MSQRNIRVDLSYDGHHYCGWQKQKSKTSVQGVIEKYLSRVFLETVHINGIGRTDSGAHAFRYTMNFRTKNTVIPLEKVTYILNNSLPKDIRFLSAELVPIDFHARYSAKAREYVYVVLNEAVRHPVLNAYTHLVPENTDIDKLKEVCKVFRGAHDFRNFCYGYQEDKNFVRTVHYFRVCKRIIGGQSFIYFYIKGSGFLKGMIRSLVSASLNYAQGKLPLTDIKAALDGVKDLDTRFKFPVPASGLFFKRGYY